MEINLAEGKYVLAVSGGVDSMVLLDLLSNLSGVELVVAHFNHGIREDSAKDETLVKNRAKELGLPFKAGYGRLGPFASEEEARDARYEFLFGLQAKYGAQAIITAHHQDDLIETAIINLLRGTGYRGLTAILNNRRVLRPLLGFPKAAVLEYARRRGLEWRDDQTNQDPAYLRNYVRINIVPRLSQRQRQAFIKNIDKAARLQADLDPRIEVLSRKLLKNQIIDRNLFISLPTEVGSELLAYWLREQNVPNFDKKTVDRLNMALRTSKTGAFHPVKAGLKVKISSRQAEFISSL